MDKKNPWDLAVGETRKWTNNSRRTITVTIESLGGFKVTQTVLPGAEINVTGDGWPVRITLEEIITPRPPRRTST